MNQYLFNHPALLCPGSVFNSTVKSYGLWSLTLRIPMLNCWPRAFPLHLPRARLQPMLPRPLLNAPGQTGSKDKQILFNFSQIRRPQTDQIYGSPWSHPSHVTFKCSNQSNANVSPSHANTHTMKYLYIYIIKEVKYSMLQPCKPEIK